MRGGEAVEIKIGLIGPVGNRIQFLLTEPSAEFELMVALHQRIVLFRADHLCVLRPGNDAVKLDALVANVKQVRSAIYLERIRSAELGRDILRSAFLIQAVLPIDGRPGGYRLHEKGWGERMRPGNHFGIGTFPIGFAIP